MKMRTRVVGKSAYPRMGRCKHDILNESINQSNAVSPGITASLCRGSASLGIMTDVRNETRGVRQVGR